MNDDAVLYSKSNSFQRRATTKVLDEFSQFLNWRLDSLDTALDVGCGSGDVTVELILPILPSQFRRLVACDLSEEMIEYARQNNPHPKVVFEKLDIRCRARVDEFSINFGPFDHIFSFFCLNWVKNQKQAISNIHELLTPEGDCLLMFITSTNMFAVHDDILKAKKWSKYIKVAADVDLYNTTYQYVNNSPVEDFRQLCKSVGFTSSHIQAQETTYTCENYEEYKSMSFSFE